MNNPHPEKRDAKEIEILNRAFQSFNEATEQLQSSYDELQARIKVLDIELARKNEALETNLREKEEVKNYLHNILESLTTGVIVVDRSNKITTFNKTAGSITGLTPESCLHKPLGEVFSTNLFENLVHRVTNSGGQTLSLDRELDTPHHGKIHARISTSPVVDNRDQQIGTVLNIQDITQLRRLEEEAQRNHRLRATGEMAAGIAHEIRNPLGSIELFSSLLKKDLHEDEEKRKIVEHISASVKNMDRIISSLLLFAKSPQPSRQTCDLNRLISELFKSSPDILIPENIRPVFDLGDHMIANGDEGLLKQVFINLIRNGIQAMPDGGELRVATQRGVETEPSTEQTADHRQFITITVADSGEGISRENLANVFNPFFTTKDQGTGLGLSISHNIVKAHQGTIDVESEEGKGTRFILNIPCWDDELDKK
ncbi:hypothetical protein UR09_05770 [Candidatus Nitromaritima sp. SCGC AAA799-A02]|nr:hypothetical protein UR09_05770 [Candidatus Nitromaritima sp. SCGC AAA799-A02]